MSFEETDDLTLLSGIVKYRDEKKWKIRYATLRRLSPVADTLHLQLFKDGGKGLQTRASLSLDNFRAMEAGFTLDKESNTLALLCEGSAIVLAFNTREALIQWQVKITSSVPYVQQFCVQLLSTTSTGSRMTPGQVRLHVQNDRVSLVAGTVPRLMVSWSIGDLRRFGLLDGRYVLEGGARCGAVGSGVFVFAAAVTITSKLTSAIEKAAAGQLHSGRLKPTSSQNETDGASCVLRRNIRRSCSRDSTLNISADSILLRQSSLQWSGCSSDDLVVVDNDAGSSSGCCSHGDAQSVVSSASGGSGSGALFNSGKLSATVYRGDRTALNRHTMSPQCVRRHRTADTQLKTTLASLRQTGVLDTEAPCWSDHVYSEPRDNPRPVSQSNQQWPQSHSQTVTAQVHCTPFGDNIDAVTTGYDSPRSHPADTRHVYEEPGTACSKSVVTSMTTSTTPTSTTSKTDSNDKSDSTWYQTPRSINTCSSSDHYQTPGKCHCVTCKLPKSDTDPPADSVAVQADVCPAIPSEVILAGASSLYSQLQRPVYAVVDKQRFKPQQSVGNNVVVVDDLIPIAVLTRSLAAATNNTLTDTMPDYANVPSSVTSASASISTDIARDTTTGASGRSTQDQHLYQEIKETPPRLPPHADSSTLTTHGCAQISGNSFLNTFTIAPTNTSSSNAVQCLKGRDQNGVGRDQVVSGSGSNDGRGQNGSGCGHLVSGSSVNYDGHGHNSESPVSLPWRCTSRSISRRQCVQRPSPGEMLLPLRSLSLGRSSGEHQKHIDLSTVSAKSSDKTRYISKTLVRNRSSESDSGVSSLDSSDSPAKSNMLHSQGSPESNSWSSGDSCTGPVLSAPASNTVTSASGGLRPVDKPRSGRNYEPIDRHKLLAHMKC